MKKTKLHAYIQLMRLERPVGTLLLAWNSLWGLWLAGEGRPPAFVVFVILLGTWTMRSAGCVFNDLADRNFDGHVTRTQFRPLANGHISTTEALAVGCSLLLISFALVLLLNWQSIVFAFVALALALIYPFCKRFLPTPQAVLGLAFACPILMAQTAILGKITIAGICLYLGSVFWALVYDTYYALVDREDDQKIGLKSSAIFATGREHFFIAQMAAIMLFFLTLVGIFAHLNIWYYSGLFVAAALFLFEMWYTKELEREKCFSAFVHNNWVGGAIWAGLVLTYLP